jgi:hypothetical protein
MIPSCPLSDHACRIATGQQAGRQVFAQQTLPAYDELFDGRVGKMAGFSLYAGVAVRADLRKKLECHSLQLNLV